MKKSYFLLVAVCLLLFTFLLSGCGSGPGSPGSTGTEDTGIMLDAIITPLYIGKNTNSVDVVQQTCTSGTPETFTDHSATLTVTARLINTNPQIPPGILYVEKYTVEYRRSQDSIGAPPIETDTRYGTIVITPPQSGTGSTTTTVTVIFVDLKRKDKYLSDVQSGAYSYSSAYLNNYTATYTFEGQSQYGKRFTFMVQADFQMGSFDNCQ